MNKSDVTKYLRNIRDKAIQNWLTHTAVVVGANSSTTLTITVPSQYDFHIFTLQSKQSGVYTTEIRDAAGTYFNNKPLHSSTIFGNGNLPYKLPYPYLLRRSSAIVFNISDLSGSSNTIQITLGGVAYYSRTIGEKIWTENKSIIPFIYTFDDTPVSVGTTDTSAKITLAKEHDWLMTKISYKDNNSSVALQAKLETSGGNSMQNEYIDVATTFGNAQYPYIFQNPTTFYGGNSITMKFKDSSSNTLYMSFGGIAETRGIR